MCGDDKRFCTRLRKETKLQSSDKTYKKRPYVCVTTPPSHWTETEGRKDEERDAPWVKRVNVIILQIFMKPNPFSDTSCGQHFLCKSPLMFLYYTLRWYHSIQCFLLLMAESTTLALYFNCLAMHKGYVRNHAAFHSDVMFLV